MHDTKELAGSGNAESDATLDDNAGTDVATTPKPIQYLEPETNLFKITRILVELTFTATTPATRLQFDCAVAQNEKAAEIRQGFYSQPDAARTREAEFAFLLDYMDLVVNEVRGVAETVGSVSGARFTSMLREAGLTDITYLVGSTFFDQYIRKTQPNEFFR